MIRQVNYTVVGLFVLLLSITLVTLFTWLVVRGGPTNYRTYLVYTTSDVAGLSENAAVRYNGVKVGYVTSIRLNKKDPKRVIIKLKVEQGIPINTSTVASVMPQGITGLLYLNLTSKKSKAPKLKAKPGEPFPVIPAEPSVYTQIGKAVPKVAKSMEDLLKNLNQWFNKTNRQKFDEILSQIDETTKTLARNTDEIDQILKNADESFQNINKASQDLPQVSEDFQKTLEQVKQAAQDSEVAIAQISDQLLPSTQALVHKLYGTANNLEALTQQLNQNPSILFRGKAEGSLGPGEGK